MTDKELIDWIIGNLALIKERMTSTVEEHKYTSDIPVHLEMQKRILKDLASIKIEFDEKNCKCKGALACYKCALEKMNKVKTSSPLKEKYWEELQKKMEEMETTEQKINIKNMLLKSCMICGTRHFSAQCPRTVPYSGGVPFSGSIRPWCSNCGVGSYLCVCRHQAGM